MLQMAHRAVEMVMEMVHQAPKEHQAQSQMNAILATAQTVHPMQMHQLVNKSANLLSFPNATIKGASPCIDRYAICLFSDDENKNQKETSSSSSLVGVL